MDESNIGNIGSSTNNISRLLMKLLGLNKAIRATFLGAVIVFAFFGRASGILVEGSLATITNGSLEIQPNFNNQSLYPSSQTFLLGNSPAITPITTKQVVVTAYSSTPDQTDDTPFITASGKTVEDGIVASNFLAFGTKIRLPELYGDKIFIIEDRMNKRFPDNYIDIWFPDRQSAIEFGVKEVIMEILE